jgi:signal transduction histidine kinase
MHATSNPFDDNMHLVVQQGCPTINPGDGDDASRDSVAVAVPVGAAVAMHRLLRETSESLERAWHGLDESVSVPEQSSIARARAKVRRVDRLTADLVASMGGQRLAPTAFDLVPLLNSLARTLRRTLDASIAVTVDIAPDCPPCLVDERALEDALINLVVNARDAMPQGGRLQFRARPYPLFDGRPGVALSVSDSGVGMTPDVAMQATAPFFSTKSGDALAGLGLTAASGFASQSGGFLELDSSSGAGTTVIMYLMEAASDQP